MASETTKLDQIVKGAPPPNISPSQMAQTAKSGNPRNPSITAPIAPSDRHTSSSPFSLSALDPRDILPSSPPQIYLNLLILESSLRLQYLSLRARLRLHLLLLAVLGAWVTLFTYLLFMRPREDGSGVGGSVYWVVESVEKLGWCGGVVTSFLFWGTGMYERGVRWPRKFISTTNRGLRGFNMKVVLVRGSFLGELGGWLGLLDALGWFKEQRVNFQIVPKDIEAASTANHGPAKDHWNHHATRHGLIEEDIAASGNVLKLLLLPKPFSPDFREGWETFRMEYWEKENGRRADLRKAVKSRRREVARREGGWLWWTGWRGWRRIRIFTNMTRRSLELEKLALKEKPSAERLRERRRKEGLLRSDLYRDSHSLRAESHSRGSSRSSTPGPDDSFSSASGEIQVRGRRGSSSARRPHKKQMSQTSRLSATETIFQGVELSAYSQAPLSSVPDARGSSPSKSEDGSHEIKKENEIKVESAEA
ncbi:Hypothetical protein R9X50_00080600 [Acrodontium crateriforme]|uniref:Uncharacterized protein n=1 Tax=Acrodontium crateriforme TaxID=150365 RepID=A0AAQ3LYI7_9PEZI|nr:Hypothetical protein R9X50_00080600 [Acrodontium crateriforme]